MGIRVRHGEEKCGLESYEIKQMHVHANEPESKWTRTCVHVGYSTNDETADEPEMLPVLRLYNSDFEVVQETQLDEQEGFQDASLVPLQRTNTLVDSGDETDDGVNEG